MAGFVFVMGAARSGTTAMAELLNHHPRVCLGIERFKYVKALSPALFEEERFFAFDAKDTNILPGLDEHWRGIYEAMRFKWPGAVVHGDKLGARLLGRVLEGFPDARIVYMLRGIDGVASSWNARARKGDGRWPASNDFRAAVPSWNTVNAAALEARSARPSRMLVVEYERFFSGGAGPAEQLAAWLGVEPATGFLAAHAASSTHYRDVVAGKPREPMPGQSEFIRANADLATYGKLLAIARSQSAG